MQERQRDVTNVYTITRSNLMSLRLVFLAPMKNSCLTVDRRAIFEFQRSCRLTGLRVAASASRQERQRYEVINYSKRFISRNRTRIRTQGNAHFCGFALFQLEHVAKGNFWKPRTFANSYPQQCWHLANCFCNVHRASKYVLYLNTKPQSPPASTQTYHRFLPHRRD